MATTGQQINELRAEIVGLEGKLEAANKLVASATGGRDDVIAQLTAKDGEHAVALKAATDAAESTLADVQGKLDAAVASAASVATQHATAIAEKDAAIVGFTAQITDKDAKIEVAKAAMARPEYLALLGKGEEKGAGDGGDADGGDADEQGTVIDQWMAAKAESRSAGTKFWKAHKKEIKEQTAADRAAKNEK